MAFLLVPDSGFSIGGVIVLPIRLHDTRWVFGNVDRHIQGAARGVVGVPC